MSTPDDEFDCLSESELQGLSSDDLIAYIRKATDAGRPECAETALSILCFRFFEDIVRRVSLKVPRQDCEDVAMTVILSAIKSAFDGASRGEFRKWLNTIIARRIADYHRKTENDPDIGALPTEHLDDEGIWGDEPSVADESGKVVVESAIEECMVDLSESHRDVVELNVFDDLDATATADAVNEHLPDLDPPMSAENVHKIVSRFRKCLRKKLEDD